MDSMVAARRRRETVSGMPRTTNASASDRVTTSIYRRPPQAHPWTTPKRTIKNNHLNRAVRMKGQI